MTLVTGLFILLMVLLNAVFAAYEIALASASSGRLKTWLKNIVPAPAPRSS